MKLLRKVKGFTLIELLIVMAIVGILTLIVVSECSDYRKRQTKQNQTEQIAPKSSEKSETLL